MAIAGTALIPVLERAAKFPAVRRLREECKVSRSTTSRRCKEGRKTHVNPGTGPAVKVESQPVTPSLAGLGAAL